jgi:alkylation response protein AidB-like acyl-CoA dehydrogenase
VEFSLPAEVEDFRQTVRRVIRETVTPDITERQHSTGTFSSPELNRALAKAGVIDRAVPGLGRGHPLELWVLFNELEKAGAPYDGLSMAMMVAGVVAHVGTQEQKDRVLPGILAGEELCSLGYSEPDNGSDVAAATTTAVRDGDGWIINGAKMWTTMAQAATWVLLLTRTDSSAAKHRGLTMFILPLSTPGITIQPVHTMGTERTNATYYDDVRVGDEAVLGEVNGGWKTMGVALAFERGVMGGTAPGVALLRHFRQWAEGTPLMEDPLVRNQLARIAIDNEVASLLTQRAAWIAASGGLPGLEGSMAKVFATESYQKASRWLLAASGPAGLLGRGQPGAAADGWIEYDARHSPVTTIYGGTTEINRNNIAERHLGLPMARK